MSVTNSRSKIFPSPRKILYVYMRHGKIWALKVSVWQQHRVRRVIGALNLLSGSLAAGSICEFCRLCQELPRCSHVLGIRLGLNPPTSSACTHTLATYNTYHTHRTDPSLQHLWGLGGVSNDKKALAEPVLLQPRDRPPPRAHFLTF